MSGPFTAADKALEAKREVAMRRRVYPRWIAAGRMKQDHAERLIACMEAIQADYEALAAKERLL